VLCLAPLAGFESTTRELTVVFIIPLLGENQLHQLNQLHDYTEFEVNMLHFGGASAENNAKIQIK